MLKTLLLGLPKRLSIGVPKYLHLDRTKTVYEEPRLRLLPLLPRKDPVEDRPKSGIFLDEPFLLARPYLV